MTVGRVGDVDILVIQSHGHIGNKDSTRQEHAHECVHKLYGLNPFGILPGIEGSGSMAMPSAFQAGPLTTGSRAATDGDPGPDPRSRPLHPGIPGHAS
jgi:hypothetical protein